MCLICMKKSAITSGTTQQYASVSCKNLLSIVSLYMNEYKVIELIRLCFNSRLKLNSSCQIITIRHQKLIIIN